MMKQSRLALKLQLLRFLKNTQLNYQQLEKKLAELHSLEGPSSTLYGKFRNFVSLNKQGLKQADIEQNQEKPALEIEYVEDSYFEKNSDSGSDSEWSINSKQSDEDPGSVLIPRKSNIEENKVENKQKISKTQASIPKKNMSKPQSKQLAAKNSRKNVCKH